MKPLTREEIGEWKARKAERIVRKLKLYCKEMNEHIYSALHSRRGRIEKLRTSIKDGWRIVDLANEAKDYGVLQAFQPDEAYLCGDCMKLHACTVTSGHIKKLRASEEKCAFCNGKALYYSEKLTSSRAYFFIEKAYKEGALLGHFCAECFLSMLDYAKEFWFTQSDKEYGCSLFLGESQFHVLASFFDEIPKPLAEIYKYKIHPRLLFEKPPDLGPIPITEKARKCAEPEELTEKLDRLTAYLPEIVKEEVNKQLNEKIEKELGYLRSLIIGKRNVKKEIIELLKKEGPLKPSEIARKIKAKHGTVRVLLWRLTKKGTVKRRRGKYTLSKNQRS